MTLSLASLASSSGVFFFLFFSACFNMASGPWALRSFSSAYIFRKDCAVSGDSAGKVFICDSSMSSSIVMDCF